MKRLAPALVVAACVAVFTVSGSLGAQTDGVPVPTADEFNALSARVAALEERVDALDTTTTVPETTTTVPATTTTSPPSESTTTTTQPKPPAGRDAIIAAAGLSDPSQVPAEPTGSYTAKTAGEVVENRHLSSLTIEAPNVTVRNVKVTSAGLYGVRSTVADGLTVEHSELDCTAGGNSACLYATKPHTVMTSRVVAFGGDAVKAGNQPTYEGNFIKATKPAGASDHTDGVQIRAGADLRFVGNVIETPASAGGNAALIIQAADGRIDGVVIDGNWLNGGNYTVYTTAKTYPITDVTITNNRFGRDYRYGVHRGHVDVWAGNTFDDGTPL